MDVPNDTLACARCKKEFPQSVMKTIWWLPQIIDGPAGDLYCPDCRRIMNTCTTFLAVLTIVGIIGSLLMARD